MSDAICIPHDTIAFLNDLAAHNDRDWFKANRARYEAAWLEPAKALVEALIPGLAELTPPATGEAKVNGSIWRLQRDTRFSADKTPYKTHMAMLFWLGSNKKTDASYYLAIHPDHIGVGAGMYGFDKPMLTRFRDAVASERGAPFAEAVAALQASGHHLGGETLKRVPKPWDDTHPRADLLKHKGFYVARDLPHPASLHTPAFVDDVLGWFAEAGPVAGWLQREVAR